ncbi:sensor histidine kinase [bacterium]|nr:sensor histidine kinase [bacterium]
MGARWLKLGALVVMAGAAILAHYLTPASGGHLLLHDVYARILYLPVILAGFWFGWRGGLLCAFLVGAAYFPHIYQHLGGRIFSLNLNRTLEAVVYLLVGGTTGWLADRLRRSHHRLERQSRQLAETLSALTERTREVFTAEEQLRRADRLAALGQLTTGLAHEIRNPLGSLRGAAEILSDPETPPDTRRRFSGVLVEEVERLDGVLKNFLDYARAQKDGGSGSSDLCPVLARLATLLGKRLDSAGIRLELNLPAQPPALAIGEDLLQQVLLNLMLNAIEAMPAGGTLSVSARPEAGDGRCRITVADTGPGIPKDIRERIFDPFFTTKSSGTGLGLSIVHKIVTGHHGQVSVLDREGAGASLIVELPLA